MNFDFDGEGQAPAAPQNNATNVPAPGTPEAAAWIAADKAARDKAGSGVNHQRLATLAADQKAVEESRARHGSA